MEHLILLYYVITFLIGSFAIGTLTLVYLNKKDEKLKIALFLISSMLLLLFSHFLPEYIRINKLFDMNSLVFFREVVRALSTTILSYYIMLFIFTITKRTLSKKALAFFFTYSILTGLFSFKLVTITSVMILILMVYSFVYSVNYIWFKKEYLKDDSLKRMQRYSIVFTISFMFVIFDAIIPLIDFLQELLPYGFLAFPTFIVLLSVITIKEVLNYFTSNFESKSKLNEIKMNSYKITNREKEVIECIFLGNTYQQVADSLHISLSTVKTHINNVYKKMEVNNKIEMLHRLQ